MLIDQACDTPYRHNVVWRGEAVGGDGSWKRWKAVAKELTSSAIPTTLPLRQSRKVTDPYVLRETRHALIDLAPVNRWERHRRCIDEEVPRASTSTISGDSYSIAPRSTASWLSNNLTEPMRRARPFCRLAPNVVTPVVACPSVLRAQQERAIETCLPRRTSRSR